jgi:CHAT domain-containing protein/tetratricopeptide (TPR) repeat protein
MNLRAALAVAAGLSALASSSEQGKSGTGPSSSSGATEVVRLRALHASGRHAEAESLAASVLERLETSDHPDSLDIALALFVLGDALEAQGKWEGEKPLVRMQRAFDIRSRRLPQDHFDLGLTAMRLAELEASVRPDAAIAHARTALTVFQAQPSPNDTLIATTYLDLGQIESLRGNIRAALEPLQKAVELRTRLFGPIDRRVAVPLTWQGDVFFELGEIERSREMQERTLAIYDSLGNPDDLGRAGPLSRLGEVHHALGDLATAIEYMQECIRLATASGDSAEIVATRHNLAVILQEFGDHEGTLRIASALLPLTDRFFGHTPWVRGTVLQISGAASLVAGDTAQAMDLLDEAIRVLAEHPDPGATWREAVCHLNRAQALHGQKRYDEARDAASEAIRQNDKAPQPLRNLGVTSRAMLLRINEATHDTAGTVAVRGELVAMAGEPGIGGGALGPVITYWLARVDRNLGREEDAWSGALTADRANGELLRLNFATLPDSRALELSRRKSYVLGQVLELAGAESPRWKDAWDRLTRSRGLVSSELARRRLPADLRSDSGVVALHEAWVSAQRTMARHLVKASAAQQDPEARARRDELRTEVDRTEAAYARALVERGRDTTRTDVGLTDVLASLPAGTALASFAEFDAYAGSRRLIAFIARGGEEAVDRIDLGPSADLDRIVSAWNESMAAPQKAAAGADSKAERECRRRGEAVRRLVWDPIADRIGPASEIDIVPDGPVVDLRWHALPAGDRAYLVESGPLIRVLDAERDRLSTPRRIASRTMLAMGDPDFSLGPAGEAMGVMAGAILRSSGDPCAAGLPDRFPPLPGTGVEVRQVARVWQQDSTQAVTVLQGGRATEAAFKELAPRSAVVHVATHGFVIGDGCADGAPGIRGVGGLAPVTGKNAGVAEPPAPRDPSREPSPWIGRRVWLAMASADHAAEAGSSDNDGLLTAEEVVTLDLSQSDWIVLSACHSGLAESWGLGGSVGMRRAFLLAGARSVIVSHWSIEDMATAALMRMLFERRAAGETRASAALQGAMRRFLEMRRTAGRSTHPFFWAAFIASGD